MYQENYYRLTVVDLFVGGLEDRLRLDKLLCRFVTGDGFLSDDSSLLSRARCRWDDGFVVGPFLDDDVLSSDIRLELERMTDFMSVFT